MRSYKSAHRLMATASLSALLALFAAPAAVLAAPDSMSGYDHVYGAGSVPGDGAVDILAVSGGVGETIYLDIQRGDETIASHLAFTLEDEDGEVDANGDLVGVVSVVPSASVSLDGATVKVYADRTETDILYEGGITTVYARLVSPNGTINVPLATRTLSKGESRAFAAPTTFEQGGVIYTLDGGDPVTEDGGTYYGYSLSADAPESVDGHITYVDSLDGTTISTETVEGIALGTSQEVEIPSVITGDGGYYRTLQLTSTVTLSYPGTTEYTISCLHMSESWAEQLSEETSYYEAQINYVDAAGSRLPVSDKVIVNKRYLYTPPSRLHVRGVEGVVETYVLSESNTELDERRTLVLEPGAAEGVKTYEVVYEPLSETAERTWTVVLVNGSVDPKDPGREIGRITYTGKPGDTVTHKTEATMDVDGVSYVPTASMAKSYEHTFGVAELSPEQTIYYVPGNYVAPEPYEVKVNYVNIANNEVLTSESYTAAPTMRQDLELTTPKEFKKGGVEYVRLDGQEEPIRHCFYAAERTYTVYYRDVNDDLHKNTVIRTVRVEYVDPETGETTRRPTTVIDDGTTTELVEGTGSETVVEGEVETETTEGAATETGTETGVETGIGTDDNLISITDGDDSTLVTADGTDLATVRIEDDETPLASGLESGKDAAADAAAATTTSVPVIAGIVAGIAALAGFIFFFIKRRKRSDEDASSNDNATA